VSGGPEEEPRVVVRDKRRLDPETGAVRTPPPAAGPDGSVPAGSVPAGSVPAGSVPAGSVPAGSVPVDTVPAGEAGAGGGAGEAVVSADEVLQAQLAERTDDLLRLKAEFDNYRRRVDRDRASWGELAVARVLADLLPALDDADRAEQHGELTGTFRTVVDVVVKVLAGAGLERFGAPGEPFDPARHEALTSVPTPGADGESVLEVYRSGYSHAGRVVRPAQVVVSAPA